MNKEKELLEWVVKMVENAKSALNLQKSIIIELEPIGERFKTIENAAEANDDVLYLNLDWLKFYRQNPDETEVRIIIYHEIRHFYQKSEMKKYKEGQITIENSRTIQQWETNYANYIRNEGGESEKKYYMQPIEVDAYAFSICLLLSDSKKDPKLSLTTRLPDEIDDLLDKRIKEIMHMNYYPK